MAIDKKNYERDPSFEVFVMLREEEKSKHYPVIEHNSRRVDFEVFSMLQEEEEVIERTEMDLSKQKKPKFRDRVFNQKVTNENNLIDGYGRSIEHAFNPLTDKEELEKEREHEDVFAHGFSSKEDYLEHWKKMNPQPKYKTWQKSEKLAKFKVRQGHEESILDALLDNYELGLDEVIQMRESESVKQQRRSEDAQKQLQHKHEDDLKRERLGQRTRDIERDI